MLGIRRGDGAQRVLTLIRVVDSSGTVICSDTIINGPNNSISQICPITATGSYLFIASASDAANSDPSGTVNTYFDNLANPGSPAVIEGSTSSGPFSVGNLRVGTFTANAGQAVVISMGNSGFTMSQLISKHSLSPI